MKQQKTWVDYLVPTVAGVFFAIVVILGLAALAMFAFVAIGMNSYGSNK